MLGSMAEYELRYSLETLQTDTVVRSDITAQDVSLALRSDISGDSLLGAGTGRGETGVAGRVQQAFDRIRAEIQRFQQANPDCEINRLIVDSFGFSRGAAAAPGVAEGVVVMASSLEANTRAATRGWVPASPELSNGCSVAGDAACEG